MLLDPTTAIICLISLGAMVVLFNSFSLFVIMKMRHRTKNGNYSLPWLLVANIFIGLFPLPIYGLKKYQFKSLSTTARICDAWRFCYFTGAHIAMASLLIMTMEKVISLKFPLQHYTIVTRFRVNVAMLMSWIFFILFDTIPFFPLHETDKDKCHYVVKKEWAIAMNIMTMATPLPIIVASYIYIVVIACKQALRVREENKLKVNKLKVKTESKLENLKIVVETKATKKFSYIIGAYIICWLPSTIYYLLEWLCPSCFPSYYQPYKTWIRFFFKLLVMFNGIVTPILFCWQSYIFRSNLNKLVKRYKRTLTDHTEE